MRSATFRSVSPLVPLLMLLLLPPGVVAQAWSTVPDGDECRRGGEDDAWCEVRETVLPSVPRLDVDGGANGGVSVHGWDRDEIRVRARVFARDRWEPERGRRIADEVRLLADGGSLRAEGPSTARGTSWGVSWEVWAPRATDVDVRARNGGIALEGLRGTIRFETLNGGVRLEDLAGDVRGETRNGGLDVGLAGERWEGAGLDVRTLNGGVALRVPESYSARLVTGTVNGGLDVDFPITVRGRVDRQLTTTLGEGGATVRVETRNGSVRILRR